MNISVKVDNGRNVMLIKSIEDIKDNPMILERFKSIDPNLSRLDVLIKKNHVFIYQDEIDNGYYRPYCVVELRHYFFIQDVESIIRGCINHLKILGVEEYDRLLSIGLSCISMAIIKIESHTGYTISEPSEDQDVDMYQPDLYQVAVLARNPDPLFFT